MVFVRVEESIAVSVAVELLRNQATANFSQRISVSFLQQDSGKQLNICHVLVQLLQQFKVSIFKVRAQAFPRFLFFIQTLWEESNERRRSRVPTSH